jgi:hypothetical protein
LSIVDVSFIENLPSPVLLLKLNHDNYPDTGGIRQAEETLIPSLLEYAHDAYGSEAIVDAWDSFTLNEQVPMDPEIQPELESLFIPWFVFNWVADRSAEGKANCYPEDPIALDYLRKNGAGLDDFSRRFIELSCSQPYRFFAIKQVVEGQRLFT